MSQSWCWPASGRSQGTGGPGAGPGLLVCGLGPDTASCLAEVVLELMPAYWWVEPGPGISGCRALGVLGLVLVQWYVGLGPGLSGRQAGSWDGCGFRVAFKAAGLLVGGAVSLLASCLA